MNPAGAFNPSSLGTRFHQGIVDRLRPQLHAVHAGMVSVPWSVISNPRIPDISMQAAALELEQDVEEISWEEYQLHLQRMEEDSNRERFELASKKMAEPVRHVLMTGDTTSVDPQAFVRSLFLDAKSLSAAMIALNASNQVKTVPVLTAEQCASLRQLCDEQIRTDRADSVDGCPDFQCNIQLEQLRAIIGATAANRLLSLPHELHDGPREFPRVGIFVRRYSAGERPFMKFHTDVSAWTANVALTSDSITQGGDLMAVSDQKVQRVHRQEGDVTVHTSDLLHGVSAVQSGGPRYSMIMFFHSEESAAEQKQRFKTG